MFVGKYHKLGIIIEFVNLECVGATVGGLGQDAQVTPDGMPIYDDGTEVYLKVGPDNPKLIYLMVLTQTPHR